MKIKLFSYAQLDTIIHKLSGTTKLFCFLLTTCATMFSYDLRVILVIMVFSLFFFYLSKIPFKQVRLMFIYVMIFLVTNVILTYLFSPLEGVKIYGTEHTLFTIAGAYRLTLEQILYQTTKFFKYFAVIPLGAVFLLTTNPSEFASSLNGVKVSYKAAYAVSLTLRYFPDVQRDYTSISLAQQARGVDMSKKEKPIKRMKNSLSVIAPLIFSTLDRIELISNAMDLRGFSKHKKRTWYSAHKLQRNDYIALLICGLLFAFSIAVTMFVNHSAFWNPFI